SPRPARWLLAQQFRFATPVCFHRNLQVVIQAEIDRSFRFANLLPLSPEIRARHLLCWWCCPRQSGPPLAGQDSRSRWTIWYSALRMPLMLLCPESLPEWSRHSASPDYRPQRAWAERFPTATPDRLYLFRVRAAPATNREKRLSPHRAWSGRLHQRVQQAAHSGCFPASQANWYPQDPGCLPIRP